ncbi:MAG: outer membrane homotrimeric porin [Desulfovibrionaceae bacterium]
MKRIVVLATLLAMVLGTASMAAAADLTATGSWKIFAQWTDNEDFSDNAGDVESDFDVRQRLRTQFNFTANENLMGALQIEIGSTEWGNPAGFTRFDADQTQIEVKSAYINWVWPNTDIAFYAGLMPLALPAGAAGNPVLDNDVAAFVMSAPLTDNVSLLAGWARPYSHLWDAEEANTAMDILFAAVPLSFDGVALTPYLAYGYSGEQFLQGMVAGGNVNRYNAVGVGLLTSNNTLAMEEDGSLSVWYGGLTFDLTMFDPIKLTASFIYGNSSAGQDNLDRSGWLADLAVSYTGFDFVTPELFFSYSSGEDGNSSEGNGDSERLPTVGGDYGFGNYFFNSGGMAIDNGLQSVAQQMGNWQLGMNFKDISFLEGLTHSITIMYAQGTNDESIGDRFTGNDAVFGSVAYGRTLTDQDSIWEFSIVNQYKIYDQLTATLGIGYIAADFDSDVWATANNGDDDDAARMTLGIEYKF